MAGVFLTLVGSTAGSGPAVTITVNPAFVSAFNTIGSPATASISFNNTGTTTQSINGGAATTLYNWCVPAAEAGNYEIYATLFAGGVSLGSSALDTWLALSTNRTWLVTTPSGIASTNDASINVGIRRAGSTDILASADIELYAEIA